MWNIYVASVAFLTCPAQSLDVRSTGMGCFFFWKNFFPAGGTTSCQALNQTYTKSLTGP